MTLPVYLLPPTGILFCLPLVVRKVLLPVVVHPLVEVVCNVEGPVVVGGKLVVDEDQPVPGGGLLPHQDVARVDVVVGKHHGRVDLGGKKDKGVVSRQRYLLQDSSKDCILLCKAKKRSIYLSIPNQIVKSKNRL